MIESLITTLTRTASKSRNRRLTLKALGATAVAAMAAEPLAAQAKKNGKKRRNQAKKLCRRQIGPCEAQVLESCGDDAACQARLSVCCNALGRCDAAVFFACIEEGVPAEN